MTTLLERPYEHPSRPSPTPRHRPRPAPREPQPTPAAHDMAPIRRQRPCPGPRPLTLRQPQRIPVRARATWRPSADAIVAFVLVDLVLLVQGLGSWRFPSLGDDEGTYTAQAWAVRHGHLAHYTYWYDHPPLGWIQLAALSWLPDALDPTRSAVVNARLIMLLVSATSAALLYVVGRRLELRRPFAALAVMLMCVSPLGVVLQRQVYLDNFATPWLLAAFALVLSRRRHLWHHVAAGACFGAAVLSKETVVVVLPGLLVALWGRADRRHRAFCAMGFAVAALLSLLVYPLFALLRLEFFPGPGHVSLLGALQFQLLGRETSGGVFDPSSNAHAVVAGWFYYDHWVVLLGLASAVVTLGVRRLRVVGVTVAIFTLTVLKPGNYLPTMFIIAPLPFLALSIAGVADVIVARLSGLRQRANRVAVSASVAVMAAVLLSLIVPSWYHGDRVAMTADANANRRAATEWLTVHVSKHETVLTDDASWLDLVRGGFNAHRGAIWFYKLDTDPEYAHLFPKGWRSMNYVLSTGELRGSVASSPDLKQCKLALSHSRPVATFGTGTSAVKVLKVYGDRS